MKCPVCDVELKIADRQGVEIDYCPQCRGVWLDRGELDKIIERSTSISVPGRKKEDEREEPFAGRRYQEDDDKYERYGHRRRRRKSFLEDLFDFD